MENDEPIALAHVSEAGTQSLEDHLLGVSSLAETYGEKLGVSSAAALLGILHDLGKASPEFQSYICSFLPDSERPRNDLRGKIDISAILSERSLLIVPKLTSSPSTRSKKSRFPLNPRGTYCLGAAVYGWVEAPAN